MTAIDRVLGSVAALRLVWFLDPAGGVRTRIGGVVTCPICAAAGAAGEHFWDHAAALGLSDDDAARLANAADTAPGGRLRDRLLDACSIGAQSVLDM